MLDTRGGSPFNELRVRVGVRVRARVTSASASASGICNIRDVIPFQS